MPTIKPVKLSDHLEPTEIAVLAGAGTSQQARIIFKLANSLADKELERLQTKPEINTVDGSKDMRYKLGMIKAWKTVIAGPHLAVKHIEAINKKA